MQLSNIFLSDAAARAICWVLLHSLWQGMLIAALAGVIIYATRKRSVVLRYNLLAADLLLFVLLAGITLGYEVRQENRAHSAGLALVRPTADGSAPVRMHAVVLPVGHPSLYQWTSELLDAHAALITAIWLACLSIQLLRVSGGLYRVNRIRRSGRLPAGSVWTEHIAVLAARLGIRRPVVLLESRGVRTPSAIGWWKPSILVPLGLLANLPPDQVETILLHELAHIRRNDYAVNLVLHLAEAFFFFNPGLRWVAALLRREREACCDDMVLAGTPDRNSYFEALVSFTQWLVDKEAGAIRGYVPQLGSGRTDLLWRIRRMLNQENKKLQPVEKVILSFGLMALVSVSLLSMHPAPVSTATVRLAPQQVDFRKAPVHVDSLKAPAQVDSRRASARHADTLPEPPVRPDVKPIKARRSIKVPAATPPPPAPANMGTPPTPDTILHLMQAHPVAQPHAPTPDDPMIYANFQNPYAKRILLDLVRDGLAGDLKNISFVLNPEELIINGVRQSDPIFQTYRDKYIGHPTDHMIYSQHYTPHSQGAHCEVVHEPDIPYIPAPKA